MIRTSQQLNAPFKNPHKEDVTEITVTDPSHPLFGRCFPLLSTTSQPHKLDYVLVAYREHMVLRIPVAATNLAPPRPTLQTKLTLEAITALITLAEQCEVLCLSNQATSGNDCLPNCDDEPPMTSQPSCRR